MALPELYEEKEYQRNTFDKDAEFKRLYGEKASKRDTRKFNKYWNSEQRLADEKAFNEKEDAAEAAFVQGEIDKRAASWDARIAALREQNKARGEEALKKINASLAAKPVVPVPKPDPTPVTKTLTPRSDAEWTRIAKENGFADMGEVLAWQEANGLEADGKFGNASSAFFKANGLGNYQKTPEGYVELSRSDGTTFLQRTPLNSNTSVPTSTTPVTTTTPTTGFDLDAFRQSQGLKSNAFVTHNGKRYLRYDPSDVGDFYIGEDGSMYRAKWGGGVGEMIDHSKHLTYSTPNGTRWDRNYNDVYNKIDAFKKATVKKQGGTMNRINYFQQGGVAPQQQDMQAQVVALVQAAMQGDQKATQTVNQIMEAAKAGDQQAIQIAQLMEQVIKQMQGQARAAKYGAKLDYLQSLKCGGKAKKKEQGGKVCPTCEQGKPVKKSIITKHQAGGAVGFYRNWTPDEIRKLQNKLAAYGYYEGDLDGIVGSQTINAVKKFQTEHGVAADGMWGHNTNTQMQFVDASTADKGSYKKNWKTEQGSLRTYDVAGQKMKEQDYYRAINNLKEKFYANPEAFWTEGGDTAKWREHLYTTPEGTAIMEEFYGATPDDVRKKLGSRVTNRKMQQDQMDSGIREATGNVADVAVKKVLPAMASIAAAPAIVMNPLAGLAGVGGAYVGGAVGRQVGENLAAGDTSAWTSVDGMGNVASVATPTSEIVAPVTEALGTAVGGYTGWKFGQHAGKPSLDGLWKGPELRVHGKNGPLAPVSQYVYNPRPNYKPHANPNKGKSSKKGNNKKNSKEPHIDFENLSQRKANGGSIERIKYFSLV